MPGTGGMNTPCIEVCSEHGLILRPPDTASAASFVNRVKPGFMSSLL